MCRYGGNAALDADNLGHWQIEAGTEATPYAAPGIHDVVGAPETLTVAGQTATVEALLSAGSHADEQDLISGSVIRRLGVYIVTGEEAFTLSSSGRVYFTAEGTVPNLRGLRADAFAAQCTHFSTRGGNTVSELQNLEFVANGSGSPRYKNGRLAFRYDGVFTSPAAAKEWFAAQYAAASPVIVVYTVRYAETQTLPPRPLTLTAGDNTVSSTAAVEAALCATYKKEARP